MPEPSAVRTRNVKTITSEDLPVDSPESKALGVPWEEYLAGLTADELAICDVYVYRKEPLATEGYLTKVHEAIDRQWLQDRFGGGTFEVTIRSKSGKSHYERNIKIVGEPKLIEREKTPGAVAAAASPDNLGRLCDLLEKVVLERAPAAPVANVAQDSAITMMGEAAKQAIGIVADQAKTAARPPEPSRESALADKLLNVAIERLAAPPAAPAANPLVERLLGAAIDRLLAPPAAPAGAAADPIAQLTQIGTLVELVDKLRGGGAGGADWKSTLIEQIGQHAPHLVDSVKAIFDARAKETDIKARTAIELARLRTGGAAPPPAPAIAPPAPRPAIVPPPAVQTSANAPPNVIAFEVVPPGAPPGAGLGAPGSTGPAAPAPQPMAEPPQAAVPPSNEEISAVLAQAPPVGTQSEAQEEMRRKLLIVEMIAQGIPGAVMIDAVDSVAPVASALLTQTVLRAPTREKAAEAVRKFFADDPILRHALAAPRFEKILGEVLAYLQGEEEEPAEDEAAPRVQ